MNNFPAFPTTPNTQDPTWAAARAGGMDLRDYFAASVLPAVIAQKDVHRESDRKNAVWIAYQLADAMVAARGSV